MKRKWTLSESYFTLPVELSFWVAEEAPIGLNVGGCHTQCCRRCQERRKEVGTDRGRANGREEKWKRSRERQREKGKEGAEVENLHFFALA